MFQEMVKAKNGEVEIGNSTIYNPSSWTSSSTYTFTKDYSVVIYQITSANNYLSRMKINNVESTETNQLYQINTAIFRNVKAGDVVTALGTGSTYSVTFIMFD